MKIVQKPIYIDLAAPNIESHDVEAINNAIKNILFTAIGTVPGKPDFGSNLNELVFLPMDASTISMTKRVITESVRKWETRISIDSVNITKVPEYNRLLAEITYHFKDDAFNIKSSVELDLMTM